MSVYLNRIYFGIVNINIKNLPDIAPEKVVATAALAPPLGGIFNAQEVAEGDGSRPGPSVDDEDVIKGLGRGWSSLHEASENFQAFKTHRFRLTPFDEMLQNAGRNYGIEFFHGGREGLFPHRDHTWMCLQFLENLLFDPFMVANFHLNSGVMRRKESDSDADWAARIGGWERSIAEIRDRASFWKSVGYNQFWVGDANEVDREKVKPHSSAIVVNINRIDYMWFVPGDGANWNLEVLKPIVIPAGKDGNWSDHPLLAADVVAVANELYVPPKPPTPKPLTTSEKLQEFLDTIPNTRDRNSRKLLVADKDKLRALMKESEEK